MTSWRQFDVKTWALAPNHQNSEYSAIYQLHLWKTNVYHASMKLKIKSWWRWWQCLWKWQFWTRDLLMQPIKTVWTISVGDHPGTTPVEFGKIPINGSREKVVCSFSYIIQCKIVTPRAGSILTQGHNLKNFGREPIDDVIRQIWKLWAL